MAATLAHDLNNPASFVVANFAMVEQQLQTLGEALARLRGVLAEDAPARLEITRQLDQVDEQLAEAREILEENNVGVRRLVGVARALSEFANAARAQAESSGRVIQAAPHGGER